MVRHARMNGRPTLWLPGLDHASIAAQVVLDRILAGKGETRASRSAASATSSGCGRSSTRPAATILRPEPALRLVARLGAAAVHDGRGSARRPSGPPSPGCTRTAWPIGPRPSPTGASAARPRVSDLEVVPTPEKGTLWTIRYHLVDERRPARSPVARSTIATTRPETLLGDTAVAVHPDDPRYAGAGRRTGPDPVRRADRADHRRRRRPAGVRDRGGEDHPGPRSRRLRHRPAPRAADDQRLRRRRPDQRARRRLRRPGPGRGPPADPGRPRRARRPGRGHAPRDADRPLPAQQRRHRAAPQDPMVHPHEAPRRSGRSRRPAAARPGSCPTASRRSGSTG